MSPIPVRDEEQDSDDCENDLPNDYVATHISSADSSNSDTELDETVAESGYQLLPMTVSENQAASDSDTDSEENMEIITNETAAQHSQAVTDASRQHSNFPTTSSENSPPLDQDRVQEIRVIMEQFSLPVDNIPVWANVIPEDEWKAKLMLLTRSCSGLEEDAAKCAENTS